MRSTNNYAFIDSQNLNLAIRDLGWVLSFKRFRIYLRENYRITKAFLFLGYIHKYESLYQHLREEGFEIIFKPTLQDRNGVVKGNVDAELVLHAMKQMPNYTKAIIVTGDGDFWCLIEELIQQGKLLKLLVPNPRRYSALLKQVASDKVDFMHELRHLLEKK